MLKLFGILAAGIIAGLLPRLVANKPLPLYNVVAGKLLTFSIYLMLCVMGYQLGVNDSLLESIPKVGAKALYISLLGMTGSVLAAWFLWRTGVLPASPPYDGPETDTRPNPTGTSVVKSFSGSILTLLSLMVGLFAGYGNMFPSFSNSGIDFPMLALYFLLFVAGVNMGSNPRLSALLKGLSPSILLLPLCSITGTILLCALGGLLSRWIAGEQIWSVLDYVAVGSGMGYYSLSSVLIRSLKEPSCGPELSGIMAAVALLSNVLRELFTLMSAQLLNRLAGPYAPVAAAGATAADVCLPVLVRTSGDWILPAVLVSGFLTDFSVPFLVTWFCGS